MEESDRVFMINSSPTFLGYFYLGSDDDYHYFGSRWKYEPDQGFKFTKGDVTLVRDFPLLQDEIQLSVMNPSDKAQVFCEIGNIVLYETEKPPAP
ncbi:MAG: hypothetical protein AAGA45_02180 [Verrucomicrobiota bacterium]